MKSTIFHDGILESFTSDGALVRIVQSSACQSCKISSHCNSSENKEKVIKVTGNYAGQYKIGDTVRVCAAESVGVKAVLFSFVVPIFMMFLTIAIAYLCGASEAIMGISALSSLLPYYLILYFMRGYFDKTIIFYIS